jgi:hypothetical protein
MSVQEQPVAGAQVQGIAHEKALKVIDLQGWNQRVV